ncbi:matrix-remodeling-associated protein 5-like, partial [Diaphorina citri]|uniref:Matrix-remodeling-associated protein 5-like n=1 Tax=Diaphorina citri TaxID=121845 RepID=A0A1S3DRD4_DIACI
MVGLPAPNRVWKSPSGNIITDDEVFYRILSDGSLYVGPLTNDMVGNYTCLADNIFGKDDIYYQVTILSPPGVPNILLQSTTTHSISILWKPSYDGGAIITLPNILLQSTTTHSISILWKPSYDGGAIIT